MSVADFYGSYSSFWFVLVFLSRYKQPWKTILLVLGMLALTISTSYNRYSSLNAVFVIIFGVLLVLSQWVKQKKNNSRILVTFFFGCVNMFSLIFFLYHSFFVYIFIFGELGSNVSQRGKEICTLFHLVETWSWPWSCNYWIYHFFSCCE